MSRQGLTGVCFVLFFYALPGPLSPFLVKARGSNEITGKWETNQSINTEKHAVKSWSVSHTVFMHTSSVSSNEHRSHLSLMKENDSHNNNWNQPVVWLCGFIGFRRGENTEQGCHLQPRSSDSTSCHITETDSFNKQSMNYSIRSKSGSKTQYKVSSVMRCNSTCKLH